MSSLSVLIKGVGGRMGRAVTAAIAEEGSDARLALDVESCDVIIDFSSPKVTAHVVETAVQHGKALVIGTTGHARQDREKLAAQAAKVPCVWAGNFSVGVNLLFALARQAARVLGPEYDAELVEMHHRYKQDAPSGTALRLLEIIQEEWQRSASSAQPFALLGHPRHGREGQTGARPRGEIGVHSLRGGDVVGDHTVVFAALGERLELTHKASDRSIFARGALRAAHWLRRKPPGVYDMQDVLGLK
ncbi:MAG TPA: 4-hydroxy-tetrahydrodipicolinate reductase [Opitutaceae bacterium]|jgi:4-hydroxy-tetrahydrodipicolinate reductase|nr:4-hydroxy-tetrahydrodipicolinate reductase [Opitutaceae bacterium]